MSPWTFGKIPRNDGHVDITMPPCQQSHGNALLTGLHKNLQLCRGLGKRQAGRRGAAGADLRQHGGAALQPARRGRRRGCGGRTQRAACWPAASAS